MKVHMLQQGRSVSLPAQLLLVRVQSNVTSPAGSGGSTAPQLDAVVVSGDGRESAATEVERSPGSLVLGVGEPVTIRMRPPVGAATFGPDSSYTISIGGDTPESDRVVLNSVDASGLRHRDLVTLVPVRDEIVVTALGDTWEAELPPAAARARTAARAVLAEWDVPEDQAVLNVVVDVSASMRPYLRSGALEGALELVMGATQSVSSSPRVHGALCGQYRAGIGDHDLTSFAAGIAARAGQQSLSIGFRSRLVPEGGDGDLTYVITDAVPADLDPERSDQLHLVILSGSVSLAVPQLSPSMGVTLVPAAPGELELTQLTAIVASLLSGYRRRFEKGRP